MSLNTVPRRICPGAVKVIRNAIKHVSGLGDRPSASPLVQRNPYMHWNCKDVLTNPEQTSRWDAFPSNTSVIKRLRLRGPPWIHVAGSTGMNANNKLLLSICRALEPPLYEYSIMRTARRALTPCVTVSFEARQNYFIIYNSLGREGGSTLVRLLRFHSAERSMGE